MTAANIGKGVVLYDFMQVPGGAEQVTLQLARAFNADLCFGYRDNTFFDAELTGIHCIDLGVKSSIYPLRLLKTLRAFEYKTTFLNQYDWAIYSGSYAPVAVHNQITGKKILYCHTIPRFAYDLRSWYYNRVPRWQRPLFEWLADYVANRFEAAVKSMDYVLANSNNVRDRLKKYLNQDAVVVFPPCASKRFNWLGNGDYYLSIARLEPYKRVDRIVVAFKQMPTKKLVITSGGSEEQRLRTLAQGATNITFTGWVDEDRLKKLLGHAIATIYIPIDEDFGMSPVESMAAGKPVIGVAQGGMLETIIDGETGSLLAPDATANSIVAAVDALHSTALTMRSACEQRARLFNADVFQEYMQSLLTQ